MEQEHLNLLNDGLFMDTHPSLQPPNTYRNGLNGNLISHNGNNYSFESTEGTVLNWTMPLHDTILGTKFVPIGMFRIGDKLLVHSTDNNTTGGDGEIGIVTFNNAGIGTYSALYYHASLLYTQAHMIFGYGLEENDAYHRQYWTDDFNQPRTMNVSDAIFTTNIPTGSLVVGQSYMVLTDSVGKITHNAVVYGPKQAAGNVFVAVNANYTTTGSVRVIDLVDPNIFNYTPEKAIGNIDFYEYNLGGSIYSGVKLYAYRLSTLNGYSSSWTFTTNPIHITSSLPSAGGVLYEGTGSNAGLVNSGKSITLTISDIPQEFDTIQVAVIEVDQDIDVARSITIFWDTAISGTSMQIVHKGHEDLSNLLISDLELTNSVIVRCKDMATIKQRQFIGNITSREELTWTPSGTVSTFIYKIPSDGSGFTTGNTLTDIETLIQPTSGVISGAILPDGHYLVKGTTGVDFVTYNGTPYGPGQVAGETFDGVYGVTAYAATASPTVMAVIRIQQYLDSSSNPVYKYVELHDDFFDYKGMATTMYLKGYWRSETYRIGILFYDLFGNPFYVRWLDDKTIESQSDVSNNYELLTTNADDTATANIVGLTISGVDITSIIDKVSGCSIVRAKRDKQRLGQGILMPMSISADTGNFHVPLCTTEIAIDRHGAANGGLDFRAWAMGPEFDIDNDIQLFPLGLSDYIEPVSEIEPITDAAGGGQQFARYNAGATDQNIMSKYYIHHRYVGNSPKIVISGAAGDDASISDYDGLGNDFKNTRLATAGFHPDPFGGGAGSLQDKAAEGGKKIYFATDTATVTNSIIPNNALNTAGTPNKFLFNYYRQNNNLYGGTSDNAKANTEYIQTGHYLRIDAALKAAIVSGGNYVLNGLQVFGGDTFVNIYDRVNALYNEDFNAQYLNNGSFSWAFAFPCESEINTALRQGTRFVKNGLQQTTASGIGWNLSGTTTHESLTTAAYNTAYSTENDLIKYPALPIRFVNVNRFPYMVRYSEFKNLGESVDNMRKFLIGNFRNVDALHGEINNVMVGGEKLFYLQRRGVGYIPVEERQTVSAALGQATQLGIGGVAQRYDTMDKFYGCQHQSSLRILENKFIWWDMSRYSVISFGFSGNIEDTSVMKGLETFFQNVFTPTQALSTTILNIDQPLLGNGVVSVYDPIKKTAYLTFKFNGTATVSPSLDFTIGISSIVNKFIGFFSFTPSIYAEINSRVYAVNVVRNQIQPFSIFPFGSEVLDNGDNYVCILAYTTGAMPTGPSSDATHWTKTSSSREVHRMFTGDICKFFGIVYPHYIDIVVNPQISGQKSFDHAQSYGNEVRYTGVLCNTSDRNSSDIDITTTDKRYRYYDGKWNFSYPLYKLTRRLTDEYMIVRLQVKNYTTNITTSLNLQKRLVYLKSIFRFRK